MLALREMGQLHAPVERSWKLNQRHYGSLQGEVKKEMEARVGSPQVDLWRRSYDVPPPPLAADDPRHPAHDPLYADVPAAELPAAESLDDTLERVQPYFDKTIAPRIREAKNVLIAAHGNSLRALVKHLDGLSDEAITHGESPTACRSSTSWTKIYGSSR